MSQVLFWCCPFPWLKMPTKFVIQSWQPDLLPCWLSNVKSIQTYRLQAVNISDAWTHLLSEHMHLCQSHTNLHYVILMIKKVLYFCVWMCINVQIVAIMLIGWWRPVFLKKYLSPVSKKRKSDSWFWSYCQLSYSYVYSPTNLQDRLKKI